MVIWCDMYFSGGLGVISSMNQYSKILGNRFLMLVVVIKKV